MDLLQDEIVNTSIQTATFATPPTNLTNTQPRHNQLIWSHKRLRTPTAHGLIRKRRRHARHNNIQRSTNINRHRRRGIRPSSHTRAHDPHDSVQADRDTVAGAAVGRG
jgi:hypothetical protein